jgi:hypothetical protein
MANRAFIGVVPSKAAITGGEPDCMGNEDVKSRDPQKKKLTGEPFVNRPIHERKNTYEYVAQKLSNLSATARKETSHGDDLLFLR